MSGYAWTCATWRRWASGRTWPSSSRPRWWSSAVAGPTDGALGVEVEIVGRRRHTVAALVGAALAWNAAWSTPALAGSAQTPAVPAPSPAPAAVRAATRPAAANPDALTQIGYQDQSFVGSSGGSPSGSKPESKLWYNAGSWWASMWDPTTAN